MRYKKKRSILKKTECTSIGPHTLGVVCLLDVRALGGRRKALAAVVKISTYQWHVTSLEESDDQPVHVMSSRPGMGRRDFGGELVSRQT